MKKLMTLSILLNFILTTIFIFKFVKEPKINSDQDKAFYTLGTELGKTLERFNLSPDEFAFVNLGLKDKIFKKSLKVDPSSSIGKMHEIEAQRVVDLSQAEVAESEKFLKTIETKSEFKKTASGLLYRINVPGKGASPKTTDSIQIHYEGKLRDGTVFDSSARRNSTARLRLESSLPCWKEAFPLMKVGSKMTVYCPSPLGYGTRGAPPLIPGGAALNFELELISIESPKKK